MPFLDNKSLQTSWLKRVEVYSLTVPRAGNLDPVVCRASIPWRLWRRSPSCLFLASSGCLGSLWLLLTWRRTMSLPPSSHGSLSVRLCLCISPSFFRKTTVIEFRGPLEPSLTLSLLVLFSHSVVSDSLRPHGLPHTRLPCPLSPGVGSNSCLLIIT